MSYSKDHFINSIQHDFGETENKVLSQHLKSHRLKCDNGKGKPHTAGKGTEKCEPKTSGLRKNSEICPRQEREYILNVIKKVKSLGKGAKQKDIETELVKRCYKFSPGLKNSKLKPEESGAIGAATDSHDDTVKQEIKKVIGSLEEVLDELNHVVGDLRSVVSQIDDITSEIESSGSPNSSKKLDDQPPESRLRSLSNAAQSCDSGFVGCSLQTLANVAVKSNPGDESMSSTTADSASELYKFPSTSSGNQGHTESNGRSISVRKKSTPPLCKKCQLRSNNAQLPKGSSNCSYGSNSHSSVCSKLLGKQTKHSRDNYGDTTGYYTKVIRPPGRIAKSTSIKHRSISRTALSDSGDFYEQQLDQRLENLTGIDSQAQGFSTLDWFTLEKRSYSDTLFNGGDTGSDRESLDSSDEDEAVICKQKDDVLKASDTFRFKIKQISLRQVKTAHWRVVIQP